ncbi:MMPL family transporter [Gordonia sp. HY002]|uniref:MMPL family transporter n=1 Tax=Gordonia zhenghanii TaxID=2911516 RepID=UPI001EF08C0A|nr:MMPL family transporter [Gordonia zhenghanii]MCF8571269.1 MMPL family transporter [Gordonia zhenghanii]MCF8601793.1 MMPL family transporter [Gordonia zhenghanii]
MLSRVAERVVAAPRIVLAIAVVILALSGVYGLGAAQKMLSGGFEDPSAESSHATAVLDETFDRGGMQFVVKLDGDADISTNADAIAARDEILAILDAKSVARGGYVQQPVMTVWNTPDLAGELLSTDKTSTQIVTSIGGGDEQAPGNAEELADLVGTQRHGVDISTGGMSLVYGQINEQTSKDLAVAEAIAIPISFLLLIVVFGGVVAALLPVLIGGVAIVCTLALLRLLTSFVDVSIFALNLTTAMGLALAIDYTLLMVTRYREEVARGLDRRAAIVRTVDTAGRTVAFSAVTVALALAALAIFPMYFLRSFAYAGVGVVVVAAIAALVVTPALLMVLGDRVDALDVRRAARRLFRRPATVDAASKPIEESGWYRLASAVVRRAVPVAVIVPVLLLILGAPFLNLKFGFPDERVLPKDTAVHAMADETRADFAQNSGGSVLAVIEGDVSQTDLRHYAAAVSKVGDVGAVTSPVGTFVDGNAVAPGAPGDAKDGVALLSISSDVDPMTDAGSDQIAALRALDAPPGGNVSYTGLAAVNADAVDSMFAHLPWVLIVIAVATYILLFLFTGSVLLPLKALVVNVLSLSATFGAMVWIFQDGHLGALGTTPLGYLVATMPVLMFCIAFGLSMDYEVFLLGRIREEWLASDRTRAANDHAVAVGLARTGRVVTAAALLMAIVFAGIAASEVSFMRMFGVGLTLAVLMDATVIRMFLVPAFMRLMGAWNWWAPGPLRRLHDRIGFKEE